MNHCLHSLAAQQGPTSFEVLVVDDGSGEEAPVEIRRWANSYPLTILRQSHAGIPAARNHGVRVSRGSILVCVDADCRLQSDCLARLDATITRCSQHHWFQMRLVGDPSTLVGRAEHLRLLSLQQHLLQPDGRIRYLNTAGFAIRRSQVDVGADLFDFAALRAEDTLLLSNLMQKGDLPFFVGDAMIQHAIPLSLMKCFAKDIRSAYLERRTFAIVAARGLPIRVTNRERLQILAYMWKTSRQRSIGRSAWFVLTLRQALQRTVSVLSHCRPAQPVDLKPC